MLGLNNSLADPFYAFYRLSLIGSFAYHGFYPLLMPFNIGRSTAYLDARLPVLGFRTTLPPY